MNQLTVESSRGMGFIESLVAALPSAFSLGSELLDRTGEPEQSAGMSQIEASQIAALRANVDRKKERIQRLKQRIESLKIQRDQCMAQVGEVTAEAAWYSNPLVIIGGLGLVAAGTYYLARR